MTLWVATAQSAAAVRAVSMLREPPVPAYRCEKNTPLVRALLAGVRAAGGTPRFK